MTIRPLLILAGVAGGVAAAFFASDPWGLAAAPQPAGPAGRRVDPPPCEIRAEPAFVHPTGYR
jgi:hypothetical protein